MNVCVTVQRPPHVHFYRNPIRALEAAGHDVHVFVRDSEITTDLLDAYDIEYTVLAGSSSSALADASSSVLSRVPSTGDSLSNLATTQAAYEFRLLRQARDLRPDVVTAIGGVAAAHVASLVDARSVVFTDTEHATLSNRLMRPFADAIWTPECFHEDFGHKHARYEGYHELAYLHPDRFAPNPDVLSSADVDPTEPLAVVRVTDWDAAHDVGAAGLDDVVDVVTRLEDAGAQVRVTAETPLPDELAHARLDLPPEEIHDLLSFATLYLGEGATMAAESAVLGTPALYVNTLRMGYTDELEARYGLLYNFQGAFRHEHAVGTAEDILRGDRREDWQTRRKRLLRDKVDTTDVVLRALGARDALVDRSEPTRETATTP